MEKNCILNHSPSLFDAPGTEAFASEKSLLTQTSVTSYKLESRVHRFVRLGEKAPTGL